MRVNLFTTGGTIDGANSDTGASRPTSDAAKWLKAQPGIDSTTTSLLNKDSREITDEDRGVVLEAVRRCANNRILVTHGTYSIAQTARLIKKSLGETSKTILFVGAWIPFAEPDSEAAQQMEFALQQLKTAAPGVYIAIDGRLWNPDTTEKRESAPGKYRFADVED